MTRFLMHKLTRCLAIFCFSCSLLSGCAAEESAAQKERMRQDAAREGERQTQRSFSVAVESVPPGAVVEVDNDMRGRTPCTITIDGWSDRTLPPLHKIMFIKAIPNNPGESVQTKVLGGGDHIPERLHFNMLLSPATPEINVNVNP
jgi:hypothetical protein